MAGRGFFILYQTDEWSEIDHSRTTARTGALGILAVLLAFEAYSLQFNALLFDRPE
jgi:hypothetical protein